MAGDEVLYQAAEQWAATFNALEPEDVEALIAEVGAEEYVDERTNLFLMARRQATDVALVLSDPSSDPAGADDYLVVRWVGDAWVVDADPVDWDALEAAAFDDDMDDDDMDDDVDDDIA